MQRETISRRVTLARLAVAPVVAAVPVVAIADDQSAHGHFDPHPEWWREAVELRQWLDAPEQEEIEDHARTAPFVRMCDLHDLIAETPARTAAGAATQLAYVLYVLQGCIPEKREMDALASAGAVLEQMAGGQANG